MTDKQFLFIMKHMYDELCAAVDNYEFIIPNPREDLYGETLAVVASQDMYERLQHYFGQLIDLHCTGGDNNE